jgi:hypothetical protein
MTYTGMSAMAAVAVLWSATVAPAMPIPTCATRETLVAALAQDFQERTDWAGLSNTGTLVELYLSKRGTWTLIVSTANGLSCIVAAGDYWERTTRPATGA